MNLEYLSICGLIFSFYVQRKSTKITVIEHHFFVMQCHMYKDSSQVVSINAKIASLSLGIRLFVMVGALCFNSMQQYLYSTHDTVRSLKT